MNIAMAPPAQLSTQNPWPGLRAFTESDREFFFGRERETSDLLDLVQRSSVVVLYGQSGLGKTSLLQAGLFPELKRLDFLPLRVRFDHGDDAPALAQQVKNELAAELDRLQISAPRPAPNETLWEYFHRRDIDFWGPRNRLLTPVIVLDQFEEVFTLGQRSEKSAAGVAQFAAELEAVLEHRPSVAVRERLEANPDDALRYDLHRQGVKFLVSLREDFLADLDPWRTRMPSLLPNRFRLERMTGAQALEVVQRAGGDLVSDEVAHGIVDFVSKSQRAHSLRSMEQRDVEPALLSVICDELNRRRVDSGKSQITADLLSHEREEIIQSFYESAFDDIDPRVRDWVEDRLLTASGYRNRAALEDALTEGLPDAAFDQLVNGRILHREERGGVVWLELTHDLLSDPASRSRAAREQRRQAEEARRQKDEAAEREARLRVQLRKSRRQTTVYGFLLLVTAIAFSFAYQNWKRAISSQQKAVESEQKTAQAEQNRAQTYQTAADMAQRLGFEIGGGSWVPAATITHKIEDAKKAYEKLAGQAPSEQRRGLDQEHARFLTKAADSLFQIGHFEDGLKHAQAALDILNHSGGTQKSGDAPRLALAEARYEEGTGLLATGQLAAARSSFEVALKLVTPIPHSESKQDFARLYVSAHLGLGEAEIQGLKLKAADPHFRAAFDFATSYEPEADEVLSWKEADEVLSWRVLALQGRGRSQWNDADAEGYYAKAAEILGTARDPGNPRWKMIVADLTYRQGWSFLRLGQYEEAKKYFEHSETAGRDLCNRDCPSALDPRGQLSIRKTNEDNWLWRLLLLQAWKGLGLAHFYLQEWDSSQAVLLQADTIAEELNQRQPSWTRAGFLHVAVETNLGNLLLWRYTRYSQPASGPGLSFNADKDPKELFKLADSRFQEARNILVKGGYSTSQDREFVRLLSLALGGQGSLRAAKAGACRRPVPSLCVAGSDGREIPQNQAQTTADQLDKDALDKYREAFRQLEPIAEIAKENAEIISDEATLYSAEGQSFNDLKQYPNAISAYRSAITALERIARVGNMSDTYSRLAYTHISLGDIYQAAHDFSRALSQFDSAMAAITTALDHSPRGRRARLLGTKAAIHGRFADISFKRGHFKDSLAELAKAITADWEALNRDYADTWLNGNMNIYRAGPGTSLDTLQKAILTPTSSGSPPQSPLTPEQSKALSGQIDKLRHDYDPATLLDRYGQTAGALRPPLSGAWRVLAARELEEASEQLRATAKKVKAGQLNGIRKLRLDFYDDAALYEADIEMADRATGIIAYVRHGTESVLLDGSLDQIRKINRTSPPRLNTPERAIAYLRFVLGQMQTVDAGRIRLIDQPEDLDWLPSASAAQRSSVAGRTKPLVLSASEDGDWQAIGSVAFGGRLEVVSFHLSRDGNVSFAQEKMDNELLPIFVDVFSDGIRIQKTKEALLQDKLKRDPNDEIAIRELISLYSGSKRWTEAAGMAKNLVAFLQRKAKDGSQRTNDLAKSDSERTKALAGAYNSLSWYQLFARDFAGALASAEAGKELVAGVLASAEAGKEWNESDLVLDTNRAHALLFRGRTQEAEAIYLENRGKKFDPKQDKTWEQAILKDFDDFEAADLTNPEIPRIRDLLSPKHK